MANKPTFSVIIPVYNTVKELSRCIDSILQQSFTDFELVLVDDGSSDGSEAICEEYGIKDNRVRCFHKENGGCSEARNYGVHNSSGEYLIFADSDDMWGDSEALADLNRIIKACKDVEVICYGVEILSEDGKSEKIRKPELPNQCGSDKFSRVKYLVYTNQYFSTSYVKVLKREFFIDNNLFFVKGLLSEDIEWSARILLFCKNLEVYPNAFYKRIRRSEGSITASIGEQNILDILGSIEKGTGLVEKKAESQEFKDLYYEYWAYQYAMLLGLIHVISDKATYSTVIERMRRLKWLLKYDHVQKVKMVRWLVNLVGIASSIRLLGLYYKMK